MSKTSVSKKRTNAIHIECSGCPAAFNVDECGHGMNDRNLVVSVVQGGGV